MTICQKNMCLIKIGQMTVSFASLCTSITFLPRAHPCIQKAASNLPSSTWNNPTCAVWTRHLQVSFIQVILLRTQICLATLMGNYPAKSFQGLWPEFLTQKQMQIHPAGPLRSWSLGSTFCHNTSIAKAGVPSPTTHLLKCANHYKFVISGQVTVSQPSVECTLNSFFPF